ncbi:MAG TPA: hypothetical protein PKE45_18295 [Caldilineaceae bacterium]|nr:hypothetical protein [Caldilineaceae bacterium]
MEGQRVPSTRRVALYLWLTVVVLLVLIAVVALVGAHGRAPQQERSGDAALLRLYEGDVNPTADRHSQAQLGQLLHNAGQCVAGEPLVIAQRPSGLFVAAGEQGVGP